MVLENLLSVLLIEVSDHEVYKLYLISDLLACSRCIDPCGHAYACFSVQVLLYVPTYIVLADAHTFVWL